MNQPVRALYKIDARPDGPAQARRIVVRECSRRVSERTLEDFELLVSELVTNRILHGEPGTDNTVLLDLRISSMLCCAVSDHGSGAGRRDGRLRRARAIQRDQTGGRPPGLRVVHRLADRWGTHRTRTGGTRVWCETAAA
jgi:anti-sigma regulatory factor (Ser/Thr protein kinase)